MKVLKNPSSKIILDDQNSIVGKNIFFSYKDSEYILKDFSFFIKDKNINFIKGDNGFGKTTLIKLILGLEKPDKGQIQFFKGKSLSYIPQYTNIKSSFPISVSDVIEMGFSKLKRKYKRNYINKKIESVLDNVCLQKQILKKLYFNISGGEKQKVLIARAVVDNFDILILDEPFSNIDKNSSSSIFQFIKSLKKTIIIVSHIDIQADNIIQL